MESSDLQTERLIYWKNQLSALRPVELICRSGLDRGFEVEWRGSTLFLKYSVLADGIYGCKRLFSAIQAQSSSILGIHVPQTQCRFLCLNFPNISPAFLETVVELGFNGIVLKQSEGEISKQAARWGLKVFVRPSIPPLWAKLSPFEPEYRIELERLVEVLKENCFFDGLYWESPYFSADCRDILLPKAKLRIELHLEELQALEQVAPVLYTIPPIPSETYPFLVRHFSILQRAAGPQTSILFSANDGNPFEDHLPPSPIWSGRKSAGLPYVGLDGKEEPLFIMDRAKKLLFHPLDGACIMMQRPPKQGGYEEANLSLLAEVLWSKRGPEEALKEWVVLNRPHLANDLPLVTSLSSCLPRLSLFQAISEHGCANLSQEEVKAHRDEWHGFCKRIEKKLDGERRKSLKQTERYFFIEELSQCLQEYAHLELGGKKD